MAIIVLGVAVRAPAGGIVTSPTEAALRAALNGGGLVTFSNDSAITISHQIVISRSATTIDAAGHNVSISGSNGVPLFNATANLTLRGLNLLNGTSSTSGGGLYINPGAVVIASHCVFAGNSVIGTNGLTGINGATNSNGTGGNGSSGAQGTSALGGAIYNQGSLALINCTLTNNSAAGGAGGSGGSGGPGSGTFAVGGNGGDGASGGLGLGGAVYNLGNLTLINCTFSANTATGGSGSQGGAGGTGNYPGLPGQGGAGAAGSGGALFNAGNLNVLASTFSTNSALGGASAAAGTAGNGKGLTGIKGGQGSGGAIYNNWWAVATNCTFYTNVAVGGAGGNGGNGGGTFVVAGNGGDGGDGAGGTLDNANTITIVNCTFSSGAALGGTNGVAGSGNVAGASGNFGAGQGGNIANTGPVLVLMNSILAARVSGGNAFGSFTDGRYNLSSDSESSLGIYSFQNLDPKLGPLADNGGSTLTMALLTKSPAIDRIPADAAPTTDQRGFSRPVNGLADIGAFEFGATATVTNMILSIGRTTNGLVQLTGAGTAGSTYVVQASTNLLNWQTISSNVSPISFVDPATNLPARFYRTKP